jgi:hypothetical protein
MKRRYSKKNPLSSVEGWIVAGAGLAALVMLVSYANIKGGPPGSGTLADQ